MIEGVRSWALTVCSACVLGALLTMLFPADSSKKLLNMIISMMILCVIFKPLSSLGKFAMDLDKHKFSASQYENSQLKKLEDEVESNAKRIYSSYIEENLRRVLDGSRISYESIVVNMDNSDDGCISIGQVEVIVKNEDEAQSEQIKQLLMPYIGAEPVVKIRELQ